MADSRSLSGRGVGKRNKTWASKNATWGFAGRWHYFATPTGLPLGRGAEKEPTNGRRSRPTTGKQAGRPSPPPP